MKREILEAIDRLITQINSVSKKKNGLDPYCQGVKDTCKNLIEITSPFGPDIPNGIYICWSEIAHDEKQFGIVDSVNGSTIKINQGVENSVPFSIDKNTINIHWII